MGKARGVRGSERVRKPFGQGFDRFLSGGLGDEAAAETDRDRVGAAPRLQLREEVPHVRLDRLLGEEEPLADLAVDEALRDQLEDFDLAHRRLLLQFAERARERDDLGLARAPALGHRVEPTRMVHVPAQDLLALSRVHGQDIGRATNLL